MIYNVSIIGLGKLGASMAAAIASRGHKVIGVDVNHAAVDAVNAGRSPVQETGVGDLIAANRERLRATMDHREAVLNSDVSFVIVPTPSDDRGAFSLAYAQWAFKELGKALAEKNSYHLVVMTSTVLPGSTRHGLIPVLEEASGKTAGEGFGVCYSPEFIALGSVVRDFLNPSFLLVGEHDRHAGETLEQCYRAIMDRSVPCKRMSLENAELAKITLNAYVTMKITFGNMVADICEQLPGGDADAVTEAIGCDWRIGKPYLKGGTGFGGPCFPRDNRALAWLSERLNAPMRFCQGVDRYNNQRAYDLVNRIRDAAPDGGTIAVLGMAYKPNTYIIDESHALRMARMLSQLGYRIVAYDPMANSEVRHEAPELVVCDSLYDACAQADTIVVATPDPEFADLGKKLDLGNKKVIDLWGITNLPPERVSFCVGHGSPDRDAIIKSQSRLQRLWTGSRENED